jgi:glycosyltransferase involved in cell wall biosynthesis
VCHAAKKRLVSVEKIRPEKIYVVYNGLNVSEVPQHKNNHSEKEKIGISNGPVIGMVGNFRGMKGHDIFIQAAQFLLKIRDDFHFLIVGDGKDRKKYELEVHSSGLKNHFHFLGRIANVYNALNLMDIFVLPSKWEGLPICILEAMVSKIPVIATDVGGIPEIVRKDQTGVLIPPNDPIALKDAVLKLLESSSFSQELVKRAHQEILQKFNQERMVRETVAVYEEFLIPLRGQAGSI